MDFLATSRCSKGRRTGFVMDHGYWVTKSTSQKEGDNKMRGSDLACTHRHAHNLTHRKHIQSRKGCIDCHIETPAII